MKHVFTRKLVLATLACIFASTLFWNSAAHAAEKHITANIGMDGELGTTAVGDAATVNAHANIGALEDGPDLKAPDAKFTYAWNVVSTESRTDPNGAWQNSSGATIAGTDNGTTSTVSTNFAVVAYYRIKIKFSVDFEPGSGIDTWHGDDTVYIYQTAVGVEKIQYRVDGQGAFIDVPNPLVVPVGSSVNFQASIAPAGAAWPANKPVWGGISGASGTGATTTVTFNTVSTSLTDYKTVTAECGNTVTSNMVVYSLTPVTTPFDDFPNRSQTRYGINKSVHLLFTSSPAGITATNAGGLMWKMTGASATDYLSPTNTDGTATFIAGATAENVTLTLQIAGSSAQSNNFSLPRTIVAPTEGWTVRQNITPPVWHVINTWSVGFRGGTYIGPKDVSFKTLLFEEGECNSTAIGWLNSIGLNNIPHGGAGIVCTINGGDATNGNYIEAPSILGDMISGGPMAPGDKIFGGTSAAPAYAPGDFNWPIPWLYNIPGSSTWNQIIIANQHFTSDATGAAMAEKAGSGQVTANAADVTTTPPGF